MTGDEFVALFHIEIDRLRPHAGAAHRWRIDLPWEMLCSCGTMLRSSEEMLELTARCANEYQAKTMLSVLLAAGDVAIEYGVEASDART